MPFTQSVGGFEGVPGFAASFDCGRLLAALRGVLTRGRLVGSCHEHSFWLRIPSGEECNIRFLPECP